MEVLIKKSERKNKQFDAIITDKKDNSKKTVSFGQKGASDFTKHGDLERKQRYIDRHKKNENWGKSGIETAGFYSRWLLRNKPTLTQSAK